MLSRGNLRRWRRRWGVCVLGAAGRGGKRGRTGYYGGADGRHHGRAKGNRHSGAKGNRQLCEDRDCFEPHRIHGYGRVDFDGANILNAYSLRLVPVSDPACHLERAGLRPHEPAGRNTEGSG